MDSPSNIRTSAKACLRNICDRSVSMRVPSVTKQHVFLRCSDPILGLLLTRRRFVTQKDSVAGAAPLLASAHARHLHPQPALEKAVLEILVIPRKTHRPHPPHL